ncbi:ASCH domain-containing protein [Simkania sp.]|uniref:ASCH domain-containing protein n=1 Tax=Simkania sp. TaxID=34094 RepID=UPI003B5286D7
MICSGILIACGPSSADTSSFRPEVKQITQSNQKTIYHLSIEKQYLDFIIDGKKIVEGRLNVPDFSAMKEGDLVYFSDSEGGRAICRVTSIGRYDSFNKMLVSEGVVNMLPQIDPNTNSSEEMVIKGTVIYRSFPGYKEGIKVYGAISFGLHYLGDESELAEIDIVNVNDA